MASSSLCEQGQVLEDLPAVVHGLEAVGALPSGSGQGEKLKLYAVKKCRLERKNKITSRVRTPPPLLPLPIQFLSLFLYPRNSNL